MLARIQDIAGASQVLAEPGLQRDENVVVPSTREAGARSVVRDPATRHLGFVVDQRDLLTQPAPTFGVVRIRLGIAEVDLVDDREHRDFEQDRIKPRADDRDIDAAAARRVALDTDRLPVSLDHSEKVDAVALYKL